jgi:hypothetical protein
MQPWGEYAGIDDLFSHLEERKRAFLSFFRQGDHSQKLVSIR